MNSTLALISGLGLGLEALGLGLETPGLVDISAVLPSLQTTRFAKITGSLHLKLK